MKIANRCDEVMGEIKVITEEHFQKIQRPIQGYTLDEYISRMDDERFRKKLGVLDERFEEISRSLLSC